jgi:hypothetical protein
MINTNEKDLYDTYGQCTENKLGLSCAKLRIS